MSETLMTWKEARMPSPAKKTIKIGTRVKINPKWDKFRFHSGAGIGTVVGKWKKDYTVDFGTLPTVLGARYQVVVPYEYLIKARQSEKGYRPAKGYRDPKSPTYNKIYDIFIKSLHGSGIDADWSVEETKSSWRVSNSYHTMNESGYYDGWADFTIIFPKNESMGNFKLEFNGADAQRLNQKYMLRNYLTDTIAFTLDNQNLG